MFVCKKYAYLHRPNNDWPFNRALEFYKDMVTIRKSNFSELKDLSEIDAQNHAFNFLSTKTLEIHERDFNKNNIVYLSIISSPALLAGYIILEFKNKTKSVQLKRILVSEQHIGIGQEAILVTEKYCVNEFNTNHIWLDVYENNQKARHIYKKLGYKKFKEGTQGFKSIEYYEKKL